MQVYCGEFEGLMTDEEMLACFADADVCVMAADYDDVSTTTTAKYYFVDG